MVTVGLSRNDEDVLDRCRQIARSIAAEMYGPPTAEQLDLRMLQRLVDDGACAPDDDWGLQSLGVVFGDLLCDAGFHWAACVYGDQRNLVVAWRDSGLFISAPVLIQKRVAEGEDCDVAALHHWASRLASEKDHS